MTYEIEMSESQAKSPRAGLIGAAGVVCGILVISLAHDLLPSTSLAWHDVLENCYYLPVVAAALLFGWRGGLAAALLVGGTYLPIVMQTSPRAPGYLMERAVEFVVLCAVGLLTGFFSDRDRKQRSDIQRTTKELSAVYLELQKNFEQMKRAERMFAVGQMAAGLAHEVRNPLASVAGAAGILQRNAHLEPKHQECVDIIKRESQRLDRLLTDFLDFARPRSPRYHTVELDPLLNSVIQLAAHGIGRNGIELKKQTAASLPPIEADPELLKQMLLNLVINAIEAMPEGGSVLLSAALQDGKMLVSVRDEGTGISPEFKDKIFDPFFSTKERGTGLGLSVAHQIIEQHNGILTAVANPDRGSTFSALLPLRRQESV